jgi:signal transduction histidine kinase
MSQSIMSLHRGTLTVHGAEGEGTSVVLTLPLNADASP